MVNVYLSGHMPKATDGSEGRWREILVGFFETEAKEHYKNLKNYPLPSVRFLSPLERVSASINAARDKMLMNQADVAVVYLNLKLGRCLGAMFEQGYLASRHIPIVLINTDRTVKQTEFIERNSDVVVETLADGANVLFEMIRDYNKDF